MTENNYFYFWGHTGKPGKIGKECLSQWYPSPFTVNGVEFKTAEHWMMFWKAMLFQDTAIALEILNAATPKRAKELGRKIQGFDPEIWDQHKIEIVKNGNMEKFRAHPLLQEYLLSTGESMLVEASPYDTIWGIGLRMDDPLAGNKNTWRGQNLLGKILTKIKFELQAESELSKKETRNGKNRYCN